MKIVVNDGPINNYSAIRLKWQNSLKFCMQLLLVCIAYICIQYYIQIVNKQLLIV